MNKIDCGGKYYDPQKLYSHDKESENDDEDSDTKISVPSQKL